MNKEELKNKSKEELIEIILNLDKKILNLIKNEFQEKTDIREIFEKTDDYNKST
tara:strand:- start:239 stop:400 length:162 start_codon:yes stop_codon:yes gene_type:complete